MKILKSILPHIIIIFSGIFIVFLILDNYNPTMNFLDNPVSLRMFWAFCILSIVNAILFIISNRRSWKKEHKELISSQH